MINDKNFEIPVLYRIYAQNVLTMQYKPGIPIDEIMTYPQDEKNKIFYKLMELLFKEIFDFGYIEQIQIIQIFYMIKKTTK